MGILDLQTYAPGSIYLTPEQKQQASMMGWLNAASQLANASASRPNAQQPSTMQLLTGGVQGFAQGANGYTDLLADQYKKTSEMKEGQAIDKYAKNITPEQRQGLGIPDGMPITRKLLEDFYKKGDTGATGAIINKVMQDNPGMNYTQALQLVQTGMRQGVMYDKTGKIVPIPGMAEALGTNKYGETSGKERAETDFAQTKASNSAKGSAEGASLGAATSGLAENLAHYPELVKTVDELRELSKKATYTAAGRLYDAAYREVGAGATEGAVASTKYVDTVRDNLLPILRQTFGPQFTENEGKTLMATLGDPAKSPQEKQASLDAFLTAKEREINAKQRRVGEPLTSFSSPDGIKITSNAPAEIQTFASPDDAGFAELPSGSKFIDAESGKTMVKH